MKRSLRYSALTAALLSVSAAHAVDRPNYDAYAHQPAAATAGTPSRSTPTPGAVVTSMDDRRGVPTFLWATANAKASPRVVGATPERAARTYLEQHAMRYRLSPAALATVEVAEVHDTGTGGIIVTFRQRVGGIEVHRNALKVLMKRDLSLVAISGNLHASATEGARGSGKVVLSGASAIAAALHDLYGASVAAQDLDETKKPGTGYRYFQMKESAVAASGLRLSRPARVKRVLYPLPDRLVNAYFLEVMPSNGGAASDAYAYVIAADDGRVFYRENLTLNAFNYRVWAEPDGDHVPLAGPHADFLPHPTGSPDGSSPAFIAPVMVDINGFNTNPQGTFDPWLALSATTTSGNNVDAYADLNNPDGYSSGDLRATTTSTQTFDRVYDVTTSANASQNQIMASVAQLFYVNNWLHDWYYDSGFDEAGGNAQADNMGRGGVDGDVLLAEAQDYSGTDNANMQTLGDGESPIMQMYVWSSGDGSTSLSVQPLNTTMETDYASFGPSSFNLTNQLALVNDGANTVTDACSPLTNAGQISGRIALIDRGNCDYTDKVLAAQSAGAVGVLIANSQAGAGAMGMGGNAAVNIPVLSVSQENGAVLKTALQAGQVTVTMTREGASTRDGTIDNSIVAHEWGHYLHHRLVACGGPQCAGQSEGWGDFVALHMLLEQGDDLTGAFPLAVYATAALGDPYFGIRRVPYSTSTDIDGFSFRHIADGEPLPDNHPLVDLGSNAESHNAGEVWTTMLFDAYAGLIQSHPFPEARRLMSDYIVGGMKMAPVEPTFTEQRDAILAAAAAHDPNDFIALAQGFARRGAGTCAVSPDRNSQDMQGVVEDFELRPNFVFSAVTVDDSVTSCDDDGILDREETGLVTIEITNSGVAALTDARATVSTTSPGVSFPAGALVEFGSVAPFSTGMATVQVALDSSFSTAQPVVLDVSLTSAQTCTPQLARAELRRVHYDAEPATSTVDSVESEDEAWAAEGSVDGVWSRTVQAGAMNHHWSGIDFPSVSDTSLVSPPLEVSADQPLVLSFKHAHKFEYSQDTAWDGAVIEISSDGGATWNDLADFADPGYLGTITDLSGNPLSDRQGFTGENAEWPGYTAASIDLGTAFAGETVQVRFRIGTDEAAGDEGWFIDDIAFSGITNAPFTNLAENAAGCDETGAGGAGGAGGGPEGPVVSDPDGCGCGVVGDDTSSTTGASLLSLFAALGLVLRGRRRR
ncbi:M36 family metallopeptidase [Chondromyces apiculatus]|uniref:PA domain-containing protein n=1 Tax=Chondromyces apiculatus DSM 436 TaxID=1192034 RepID=A0A017TCF1_9BACT|nr:M36 family metallopeptidase [Chondromyces apiculatus]EYF06557.1 Hypothetical protein CAP_1687 [Chondromyces apiculatus DSM 436]